MDWSEWVQGVAGGVIEKASEAKWVQPYQTEQMRLQALGPNGMGYYTEGQRQQQMNGGGSVGGISTNAVLIAGAAVVVLVLLRRR